MLRFGTLGAARITPGALIEPCQKEPNAQVVVVAARDRHRAQSFADEHGIPNVVNSYQEVIDHPDVNVVYNPLPISHHHEWTIKALRAGKHVLCEKSFANNAREAREMAAVADETGLVLMDAFHYRYHPIFIRAKEIYDSGMLGEIHTVDACFHISGPKGDDIRLQYETAGGVTMDIGCYPISWVRHLTGEEPDEVKAEAIEGPPHVDLMLRTELTMPSGVTATTSGDMRDGTKFSAELIVNGSTGKMTCINPLVPQMGNRIELTLGGENSTETFDLRPSYSFQLDAFIDAVKHGKPFYTNPQDAIRQMETIDRCYEAAGLPVRGA